MIVTINDETEKELHRLKNGILESAEKIANLVHVSYEHQKKIQQQERQQNPYIVKSVIKYMANGLNKTDAMILTALEFNTDVKRIENVFWTQNRYMTAVNLYAKRYTCEKLKKAGLTAKKISEILGISENHIYKLMKNNVDFWFLK